MRRSLNREKLRALTYIVGDEDILAAMPDASPRAPFDDGVLAFLQSWSKKLMADGRTRQYPDVVTFGFWLRKSNLLRLKEQYLHTREGVRPIGRGMAFHIAPSNVPINYAYSLVTGLLTGNANVVKIPSKPFEQVELVNRALAECLAEDEAMGPYIVLVRYGHERDVNDALSEYADARIVWGGDRTIAELKRSPMQARAVEISFADRYSLAVIDSDCYLAQEDKKRAANDFYNDTYLTDQNACTSPRAVIWTGSRAEEARERFWSELHALVAAKYPFQAVQAVNKLTSAYLTAAGYEGVRKAASEDNLIVRMELERLDDSVMDFKDNSGYFFEYTCRDIKELRALCDNTHCQTVSYIGDKAMFDELLALGLRGVDRIVPIGQTMDFELVWDGYDLVERLTRSVRIR